jgi:hypothetical protein
MDVRLAALASELTKIAAERERKKGYASRVAAAAPFALASAATDVPKGWLDKSVEQAVRGIPKAKRTSPAWTGVGRGLGRLGPGMATAPVFLSGVKDLQSKDKKERKKGYAKVVGSGLVYGALKGGVESGVEGAAGKLTKPKLLKRVKSVGGTRALMGAGAGALTAKAIAKAAKTGGPRGEIRPKKKRSFKDQYLKPALAGAAIGGTKGAFEEAVELGRKASARGIAAKASGRAAAGAAGVVALSQMVKHLTPKTKTSAAENGLYEQVRSWTDKKADKDILDFYKEVAQEGMGERSPSRRSAYYALHDELEQRGHELPQPKMRSQVVAEVAPEAAVGLAALGLAPYAMSAVVDGLTPTERDHILSDALDRMFIQNKLARQNTGALSGPAYVYQSDEIGRVSEVLHLPRKGQALPGVVAHELGHSTAKAGRRELMTAFAHKARLTGSIVTSVLPIFVLQGAADNKYATPKELENRAKLLQLVGVMGGAAQLPVLTEEVIANVKGHKMLRQAGAGTGEATLKMLAHAGPGFATYAVPAAIPFLAASYLKRRARKAKSRE